MRTILLAICLLLGFGVDSSVSFALTHELDSSTSFEESTPGQFTDLRTTIGLWRPITGKTIVDDQHAKTGKHCLQITGGEKSTVELTIKPGIKTDGQLQFWAERWTSRSPFTFRIEKLSGGSWNEIFNGDREVVVGRAFLSRVKVTLDDPKIEKLRFTVTSPPGTGILIDDITFQPAEPMKIQSVEAIPFTLPSLIGAPHSALVKLNVKTSGILNPISAVEIAGQVDQDTMKQLRSLQFFYGGENSEFRWDRPISTAQQAANFGTVQLQQPLSEGENYFWLACQLNPNANLDATISASIRSIKFSNGQVYPIKESTSTQRLGVAVRSGGQDGIHTYRIPGLATTNRGTLIGVYDVRHDGSRDLPGNIDVGMSRSTDGGRTWEPMKVIMDMGSDPKWNFDGIGDPTILVDRETGTIWVSATWSHGNRSWNGSGPGLKPEETGQWMLVRSDDDGKTWSKPINITQQVKNPAWSFLLQGPGKGISMSDGTLVFPAQYQDPPNAQNRRVHRLPHSTIVFSTDHGKTWHVGIGASDDTTESQVIELADGKLMLNCRTNRSTRRAVKITDDLGQTWQDHPTHLKALVEPRACMASLIHVGRELEWRGLHLDSQNLNPGKLLLFSNPDSLQGRNHMTIKASLDLGENWPTTHHLLLDEQGGRGYSCLSMIDKETVGILYEGSQADMTFQRIKLADILNPPADQKTKNPALKGVSQSSKPAPQKLSVARVFSDNMVLQAHQPIRIWGTCKPNEKLKVGLLDSTHSTKADDQGKWQIEIPAISRYVHQGTELIVASENEQIQLQNILIGEVWLCAGQSNMEWPLSETVNGPAEIGDAHDDQLRLMNFRGRARGSSIKFNRQQLQCLTPDSFGGGKWEMADSTSVSSFSGVGYYFARMIRDRLSCPVGLINVSSGGTPIEAWISESKLAADPELSKMLDGNWLHNSALDTWCQSRAQLNLQHGLSGEFLYFGDQWGPNHPFKPGFMHAASMSPFLPMSLRGVLWYQGESNAESKSRIKQHAKAFPLLVQSWREEFRNPDLPFIYVQLPALNRPFWPEFREQQRRFLDQLQNVGMAVTIDVGHPTNVHPKQKRPVGNRLAAWALANVYDQPNQAECPLPLGNVTFKQDCVVVQFNHVGEGLLSTDGDSINHFELAGANGKFQSALASIVSKDQIEVRHPDVRSPRHIRYAYRPYPEPSVNVTNSTGLPVSPFQFDRSDSFRPIDKRPNILLIISEDNGPELGCYGDPYAETPNLDSLASQGTRFDSAYVTQSVCSSSRSSILTGLYPHQNGQLGLATHQFSMFREWPSTYSILKQAGYRTGMLGKLHVNPADSIEKWIDFRAFTSSNFKKTKLKNYVRDATSFMNEDDTPFFLTVNFPDAHWPLQNQVGGIPRKPLGLDEVRPMPYIGFDNPRLREHVRGYYNCLKRLDVAVGKLLEGLDQAGKSDNTLVIYLGDHGAQFARGKVFVTEAGLRVPMIIRWPGNSPGGLVSTELVSTIDLLPTIAKAANCEVPEHCPGLDLSSAVAGSVDSPVREFLFAERNCDSFDLYFPQRSVRDSRYKLIETLIPNQTDPGADKCLRNGALNFRGSPTYEELKSATADTKKAYATWLNPPRYQLYDLAQDRHEFHNLADQPKYAEIKNRLIDALRTWQEETNDPLRDPAKLDQLSTDVANCIKNQRRSPENGWSYDRYLAPQPASVVGNR